MLPFNGTDLRKHLLRRPLEPLVGLPCAAVEFQNPVGHPVRVYGPPAAGEGPVVAPVEAAVDSPMLRDLKGVDDMGEAAVPIVLGVVPEFFEELALVYIPAAVEPGFPQLRRELFQGTQIFRLAFHQGLVVQIAEKEDRRIERRRTRITA